MVTKVCNIQQVKVVIHYGIYCTGSGVSMQIQHLALPGVLYIPFGPPIQNNKMEKGKTNERKQTNKKKKLKLASFQG